MAVSSPHEEEVSGLRRRIPASTHSGKDSGKTPLPEARDDVSAAVADVPPKDNLGKSTRAGIGGKYVLVMIIGIIIGLVLSPRLPPRKEETFDSGLRQTEMQESDETSEEYPEDVFDGLPRYNDPNDPHYAESDVSFCLQWICTGLP